MQNSLLRRPDTVLTVLFNLSQFLQSSGEQNLPSPPPRSLRSSACTRTAKIISPQPPFFSLRNQNFLYFYCFRQSGKVIQRKSTPSLGLPGWARSETARAEHTRTDTHVHTHTQRSAPCHRGHTSDMRGPGVPLGWMAPPASCCRASGSLLCSLSY